MTDNSSHSYPRKVDLGSPRYDQSTYWGRLKHFSEVTDPRTLLASDNELADAQKLVADFKASQGVVNSATEEERLWQAKKLIDSTCHPETGEKVFLPFRMASFVPTNLIVTAGLLLPNPTTMSIVFWQWMNQSVNVAFNWANANKSTPMDVSETAFAYTTAVTSSVSLGLGLNYFATKSRFAQNNPRFTRFACKFVPFVAVATAGALNVGLMRMKELSEGINVHSSTDNAVLGKSTAAAQQAVSQVAISRVLTALPVLTLPPLILSSVESVLPKRAMAPLNFALIAGSLMVALPCAIGLFPQRGELKVEDLEDKFFNRVGNDKVLVDSKGRPVETVWFNKGL